MNSDFEDVAIDFIEEIHERAILYTSGCRQQPGDDMVFLLRDKLQQVLLRPEAADLHALLSKVTRSRGADPSHFSDLRKLMPHTAAARSRDADLNSVESLTQLLTLVSRTKVTWSSHRFSAYTTVTDLIDALVASLAADRALTSSTRAAHQGMVKAWRAL